jgi:predicted CoA-binding protein
MPWVQPTNQEISQIINGSKNIAIVGASSNSSKASFFVLTYLVGSTNYNLYPINPKEEEILGLKVYKSLKEVPVPIDVVVAFRRPDTLDELLDEALELKAKVFWMQLGITNNEVAEKGTQKGIKVVQDRCIKIEHARFHGGLHLAGFDTKVISSKRLK